MPNLECDGGLRGRPCMSVDLRLGLWQDVLAGVECDACILDAPYSERVHKKYAEGVRTNLRSNRGAGSDLGYEFLTRDDVHEVVNSWVPRTRGWFVSLTSHDLIPHWEDALRSHDHYVFTPIPVIDPRGGRMTADGPASWTSFMVVARPRTRSMSRWGSLRAYYERKSGSPRGSRMGGKPLGVMREIVRDYALTKNVKMVGWPARPIVCDPFAGFGTTLLAAMLEGCDAIGAEVDPDAHAAAVSRLADAPTIPGRDGTLPMFGDA